MEISIKNLNKKYVLEDRTIHALANVNLTIPANRIFTLLGPSGCGKTTLLRSIVGLEMPDTGEISIGDEVVFSRERNIFVPTEKRGLGMVFQTYAIWPHMNVFDNVAYPLQTRKLPGEEIRQRVAKTLRFVQLEGFENRPATKLSGGQQQRVALARALVAEPKVILFDEPLSNLDAKLREETRKELRTFLSELKITAVYVTHDRMEALSLSDIIAVMKDGSIIETGSPKEIYFDSDQRFVADFIGRANLIAGTVKATDGPYLTVTSALGEVSCRKTADLPLGKEVTICVRPEFLQVSKSPCGEGRNVFQGQVATLIFIGEAYEGEILIGETRLLIRAEATENLHEGEQVTVRINPEHCLALAR
ncbi:MAG: ABC transporter ATP-binding protein [Smithellaceae bacterium]|nr:ABC transporter ATP-binding protein [Smithellaceae bacterium]